VVVGFLQPPETQISAVKKSEYSSRPRGPYGHRIQPLNKLTMRL